MGDESRYRSGTAARTGSARQHDTATSDHIGKYFPTPPLVAIRGAVHPHYIVDAQFQCSTADIFSGFGTYADRPNTRPPRVTELEGELQGSFIRFGQTISTSFRDYLPASILGMNVKWRPREQYADL